MALKVYGTAVSTCTSRVLACLYEMGMGPDFELKEMNVMAREQKHPSYLSTKNPFGQIPAFEDGDLTLFESRAINRYIVTKYKEVEPNLLRLNNIKESAMVDVWVEVESQNFNPPISIVVYQILVRPKFGGTADEKLVEANVEKLEKVLDVYEERLSKSKYLAGDFYSLADLNHIPYTYYLMKTPKASLINSRPHVKAWWENVTSRPAFNKDIFVVGSDTSSNSIEWAMAELLRNPHSMSMVRSDLKEAIAQGKKMGESDIARLPYLQAVVKETLRLHPPVPLILHRAESTMEICGFTIPKHTQVIVNAWAIGRYPNVWTKPTCFLPERFLHFKLDFKGQDCQFIPFGAGRRICPGLPLAFRMVHLSLASLLQSFAWKLPNGMLPEEMNMGDKFGVTLQMEAPLLAVPVQE